MKLYPYQSMILDQARDILKEYGMVYLALEMRLGKSIIALSLAAQYKEILFVTTKSAIDGIYDSIETMELPREVVEHITIVNYESAHKVKQQFYDLVIIDEAHKISKFPKPTMAYKELKKLVSERSDFVYLSGTPNIESGSQLFHQLALCPKHEFNSFKNFYDWHRKYGIENYVRRYGGMLAKDYSLTIDFSNKYEHLMIRMTREQAEFDQHDVDVKCLYFDVPERSRNIYDEVEREGIYIDDQLEINTDGLPTTKLIKQQQIVGGTVIDVNDNIVVLPTNKLKYFNTIDKNKKIAVYCKYNGEKAIIKEYLDKIDFIHEPLVLQIDANNTGVDLSHLDEMIIYSLTFSGANYAQVLSRMANKNRKDKIHVTVLLAKESIDQYIYDAVSSKQNFNSKYLRRNSWTNTVLR